MMKHLRWPAIPAYALLAFVMLLALVVRLYGLWWGLPDASHPTFSYHPDEMLHILAAQMLAKGDIIGKHFMYGGTLYFSILNAYVYFGDLLGGLLGGINRLADAILFGRFFSVVVSLLTILVVYQCARVCFDKTIGLLAALILAFIPAHIIFGQHVRPDEIGALFPVLTVLLSARIGRDEQNRGYASYAYVGLVIGVSVAFRFPFAILGLVPLVAHLTARSPKNKADMVRVLLDTRLALLALCGALAYIFCSPHTFFYPKAFLEGLRIQWEYQSNPFPDAVGNGPGVYQYGWSMLHQALGYPLYVLAAIGAGISLLKRSKADLMILAATVPYFISLTLTSWVVVRYTLPLLPLLAILMARTVVEIARIGPRYRIAACSIFAAVLIATAVPVYAYLKVEAGRNIRDDATQWIRDNVPRGSSILLVRTYVEDEYFNPVVPNGYDGILFRLVSDSDSKSLFRDSHFDYLVLHEMLYQNVERLGDRYPYRHILDFYQELMRSRYRQTAELKRPIEALGIDFSGWFTSHDYSIVNPGIRFYRYQD